MKNFYTETVYRKIKNFMKHCKYLDIFLCTFFWFSLKIAYDKNGE